VVDSPPRPGPPRRILAQRAIQSLFLAALVGAVFAITARNDFIDFDDDKVIYQNEHVSKGLTAATVLWALRSTESANWYPLTRLSHLADVSLFGMHPGGHHLVSVAWQAVATVLLFLALRTMTGRAGPSLVAAGVFGIHPLQVESVAWAAERSNVLAGAFFAATLLLWARYVRRPGPARLGACVAACALGLTAKPTLVTLPFVLLLLDFWPLGRLSDRGSGGSVAPARLWRCLLEKTPFLALAGVASALTMATQAGGGALHDLSSFPLRVRLGNALVSYWAYLGKLFWPARLGLFYPVPAHGIETGIAVAAGLALVALTLAAAFGPSRRRPWLAAGWLWFLGMLVPMIGLVKAGNQAYADRFMHLPMIGLALGVAWQASEALAAGRRRAVAFGAGAALLCVLAMTTVVQARAWRDSVTIYQHTLAVTRDNWTVETKLARVLEKAGRRPEALEHYREALRIRPDIEVGHFNAGNFFLGAGRLEEAAIEFEKAVRLDPRHAEAHNNLANALGGLRRDALAEVHYRMALQLKPDYADAHYNLGFLLARLGRQEEATIHLRESARLSGGRAPRS
jgi:tetratricopeptide (TPR) repeat protein